MKSFFEVISLSVSYGAVQALRDISIKIEEGECVALIGANGAGKTTLTKTVLGLIKAKSGKILFKGREIGGLSTEKIVSSGISLVPEGRKIFPEMTVEENLRLGGFLLKGGLQRELEKNFALFPRLRERKNQSAGTLSGGEQQMLAIARSLMAKPALLLFDEPTLGLSPKMAQEVFAVIQSIRKTGKTVLLIEQNSVLALKNSDRACILSEGKLLREGKSEVLLKDPAVREAYLGKTA